MARGRWIKPSLFSSLTVTRWPVPVRWTFVGLWTYCDDYGRGRDEPRLVKAEVWPLDDTVTVKKVTEHLAQIEKTGPLCRYKVDGEDYLHITSWGEHQKVSNPTTSTIPACPTHENERSGS